jgi:hypothetical protein
MVAGALACLAALANGTARADLMQYVDVVNAGSPHTFLATNIAPLPTVVNIGSLPGNHTYEFIVNGPPSPISSALLGSDMGSQHAAIKFDQFFATHQYGVTNYGVADFSFGVPITSGADVVLDFVVSGGTTSLFVNGVSVGTPVPFAVPLQGNVGLGGADQGGGVFRDPFPGTILAAATFDSALSPAEIQAHSNAFFAAPVPEPSSFALIGFGSMALAGWQCWRKRGRATV